MTFGEVFFLVLVVLGGGFVWAILSGLKEREKINAMNPVDRNNYVYGSININLICPHCQTKSTVHVKKVSRVATATGTVGGILKVDTKSTLTTVVTQHHCDQCNSTWDI